MKSYLYRGMWAAAVALLVGCASGPADAPWPEQLVSIDDMRTSTRWTAKIPSPGIDMVRDRSRNSRVALEVHVAADGSVQRARVAQTSGNALLDEAALLSVRALQFQPYRENGAPVAVTVVAPMTFPFYDRPR